MMNKHNYALSGLFSIISFASGMHALAQPAAFSECQAIEDRQARYDCYDRLDAASGIVRQAVPDASDTAPAPRAPESAAVRAQEQTQVQEPQREQKNAQEIDERSLFSRIFRRGSDAEPSAEAQIGTLNAPRAPLANADRSGGARNVVDGIDREFELIDTVADLDQPAPHVWAITLEDGQTWQQVTSKRYNLEEGDEVRIYPTRWGSNYRLSSEKAGGFIQVRRVR